MNEETKCLIEQVVTETNDYILENIKALKIAHSDYQTYLNRLKSYAETLGFSESDIIDVLGYSIEEIEQAKEKALEGEMFWRHNLEKAAWERQEAKRGEVDENL